MVSEPLDDAEIRRGTQIGRFVIVGELGSGGMGVVYAAHDRELDRRVALKVLRGTAATDEDRIRMLREGQAMARVTHPNVITVYEVGVAGNLVFLAQELLDGGTLGEWLGKRRARHEIIDRFVAAGRGLAAAHAAGLVHRDFKPDNVLLGKDGRVRVSDFGLARALGPADEALAATVRPTGAGAELSRSPMSPLTRTGAIMGTPMFMAPEQHHGERADERSDQFSFCVALYHALYGAWPFGGKTAVALADAVIHGRLQPPPRPSRVPARLRRILARGLRTRPADRYPSIDALLAELTHDPGRRIRRVALGAGLVVVVAAAVVGGYALRSRASDEPVAAPARPAVAVDFKDLTSSHATEWLSAAIERGQLDDALDKYDMAAALKLQSGDHAQAALARSASAFTLVLSGHLDQAQARLRDAEATRPEEPIARGYADLAAAAIASARGDLARALDRAGRCAPRFMPAVPVLAALCFELRGTAAADRDDAATARAAYAEGLAAAKPDTGIGLALAELDLDEGRAAIAAAAAAALQAAAAERGAASLEARAWIVLARALLAQAESQQALAALDHVKPATLQPFRIRIEHAIALGQTDAVLGDPAGGLSRIEAARREAEGHGFVGLVFAARLARVEVLTAIDAPEAAAEQHALVEDARGRGYGRVARLAETVTQR